MVAGGDPDPLEDGLAQLDDYLGGLGLATGWLVIFDRRSGRPITDAQPWAGKARLLGVTYPLSEHKRIRRRPDRCTFVVLFGR